MATDYLSAVLHWRKHAGSLDDQASSTVKAMLFACKRWVEDHPGDTTSTEYLQITAIRGELESWLSRRDLEYQG